MSFLDRFSEHNLEQSYSISSSLHQYPITICTSTENALQVLRSERYDVIISDMGRPPDPQAGYTLLAKIQEMKITTPYIIYAVGGNDPKHQAEALSKGAFGSASGPSRLLELVMRALTGTYSQLINLNR